MDQLHLGEPGGAWFFWWNVEEGWTKNMKHIKHDSNFRSSFTNLHQTPATRARNPSFLGFFPLGCPLLQSDFLTAHLWRAWGLQGEPGRHCWSSTMDGDRITIPRKIQVVNWQSGLVFEELVKYRSSGGLWGEQRHLTGSKGALLVKMRKNRLKTVV